jgi:hypothetical protein
MFSPNYSYVHNALMHTLYVDVLYIMFLVLVGQPPKFSSCSLSLRHELVGMYVGMLASKGDFTSKAAPLCPGMAQVSLKQLSHDPPNAIKEGGKERVGKNVSVIVIVMDSKSVTMKDKKERNWIIVIIGEPIGLDSKCNCQQRAFVECSYTSMGQLWTWRYHSISSECHQPMRQTMSGSTHANSSAVAPAGQRQQADTSCGMKPNEGPQ